MPAQNEYAIIPGNLGAFRQLPAGYKWQTALQLQNDRCQDGQEKLQNTWFWLPHGNVFYQTKEGKLGWGFTDQSRNLILKSIDDALKVLPSTGIFRLNAKASQRAIEHKSTQRFVYDALDLKDENKDWSYFFLTPDNSPEQQRVAHATGFTSSNLAYLLKKGLRPRIFLPNSDYLTKVFSGTEESARDPIWRASRLSGFSYNSYFGADNHGVDYRGALRGVRRGVLREADAPEKGEVPRAPVDPSDIKLATLDYETAYRTILSHPELLDRSKAADLARLVAEHLAK